MEIDEEEMAMNIGEGSGSGSGSTLPTDNTEGGEKMSKTAMKRAAKVARLEALKPLRRKEEKERKKAKQQQLSEAYASGSLTSEQKEQFEREKREKRHKKVAKRKAGGKGAGDVWGGGVVIDLGFDELMTDQEIVSMSSQLSYLYGVNRLSPRPIATILHTSFSPESSPRLWDRMAKMSWERWKRCSWWSRDVGVLGEKLKEVGGAAETDDGVETNEEGAGPSSQGGQANDTEEIEGKVERQSDTAPDANRDLSHFITDDKLPSGLIAGKHTLVYLSADAEEELTTLSEDEVYIIGGIVDRNRHKNLCQGKAEKLEIRTARLPIGTFIENLPTRKVLTVNQVFAILVEYINREDWAAAFEAVIPQRKYHAGNNKKKIKLDNEEFEENEPTENKELGNGEAEPAVQEVGDLAEAAPSQEVEGIVDEEEALNM